jgi:phospholipid-translocating ATPase
VTKVYGNNNFLLPSPYFWLIMFLTIILAIAPRYIAKAVKLEYYPDDLEILRYNRKYHPERDLAKDAYMGNRLAELKRSTSRVSRASAPEGRPSMDPRMASRTDMSTGMRSVHRGFDFITEEDGVAMRRMQTNLSERRTSQIALPRRKRSTIFRNIKQSMRRRKSNAGHPDEEGGR